MPTSLGVWSLGLFSSIFFLHILKQKKKKKKKVFLEGLISLLRLNALSVGEKEGGSARERERERVEPENLLIG